jgi:hypothetical protein
MRCLIAGCGTCHCAVHCQADIAVSSEALTSQRCVRLLGRSTAGNMQQAGSRQTGRQQEQNVSACWFKQLLLPCNSLLHQTRLVWYYQAGLVSACSWRYCQDRQGCFCMDQECSCTDLQQQLMPSWQGHVTHIQKYIQGLIQSPQVSPVPCDAPEAAAVALWTPPGLVHLLQTAQAGSAGRQAGRQARRQAVGQAGRKLGSRSLARQHMHSHRHRQAQP